MSDAMAGVIAVLIGLGFVGIMLLPVWIIRRRQGRKVFEQVYKDIDRLKAENQEERERAAARLSGVPTCPRCGSTAITSSRRGFKLGRGLFWGLAMAAIGFWLFVIPGALVGFALGLMTGNIGSQTVWATCVSCGCQYNPAARRLYDKVRQGSTKAQAAPGPKTEQPPRNDWSDPPIPSGFAEYLRETGQDDPRYSGRNNALECVLIDMADDKERAVMWAYAVDCARHNRTMGNILHEPDCGKYRAFSEYASRHGDVLASIADRRAWEYWNPTKTTKAYKAAAEFLK